MAAYWTGNGDGYWENSANWGSGYNGYFFLSGSYATKTVKFSTQSNLGGSATVSVQHESGTTADSPIVFLADDDESGFYGCGRLDAGEYKNGHLAVERGTFTCQYAQVGFATSTAEPLMRIGGGGYSATVNASSSDSKVFTGKMLVADGGTLNVSKTLILGAADGKSGTIEIDGGAINIVSGNGYLTIGDVANSSGTAIIRNGGTYAHNSAGWSNLGLVAGMRGAATVQVDGGEANLKGNDLLFCYYSGSSATLDLTGGGVIVANKIYNRGGGTANFTIDGGTVKAYANNADFIIAHNDLHVYVGDGGATFDCNGSSITIHEDLDDKSGETGTATFTGTDGTITLNGAVNYTGMTYLGERTHLVLKDSAMKSAILSRGLTIIKPVGASPKGTYTLLTCADSTAFTDGDISSITLGAGLESATLFVEDGAMKITVTKETQVWAGASGVSAAWCGANWNGGATWDDGNDAVFGTDGAIASIDAAATASSVTFSDNATVGGSATLAPSTVSVASGKAATINAPVTGALTKTGAGTLTLGASRTEATTLSEGTLVMDGSGTTLDWAKFVFGTDAAKPVTLGFTGGAAVSGATTFNIGVAGVTSTLVKGSGDWSFTDIHIANVANSTVELVQSNGTLTASSWFCVGSASGATARLTIEGGEVRKTTTGDMPIGDSNGSAGFVTVKTGGKFIGSSKYNDYGIRVGQGGAGTLSVAGGEVDLSPCSGAVGIACGAANGAVSITGGGLVTATQIKHGNGAGTGTLKLDGGTIKAAADNATLIPAHDRLTVAIGANGGTIDANGHAVTIAEPLLEDSLSTGGGMTFKGGGSVALASGNTYTGVTTVEVGTALSVPAAIAGNRLAFTIPSGLADGVYAVVSISGDDAFAADVLETAALPSDASASFVLSGDRKTIYCIYGNVENSWTGGTSGSLTNPDCWVLHRVPANGETAVIGSAAAATLTIPENGTFSPSVIVFAAGSAAVTIEGEGAISGITAVSNLSSSVQTIDVPLAFADAYRVHCASAAVAFTGGATATCPAADMTDNAASRALTGEIHFTSDWTATGTMGSCYTVPNGSSLYGKALTGSYTSTTFLRVEEGGYANFESVLTGKEYGRVSVRGEMVVDGVWVIAGAQDELLGEENDKNYNGVLRAGGVWKGDDTHEMHYRIFPKIKNVYVGRYGYGAKTRDYYFQFEANHTIYAADDFEFFGVENTTNPHDWGINRYGNGSTTIDTQGHTVTWSCGAQGSGGIIKAGEGTLVMNPYGSTMSSAFTVNAGTLLVAKSGATGTGAVTVKDGAAIAVSGTESVTLGGALTLESGATLAFNFTDKTTAPQLGATSATLPASVEVKITSADGLRPKGGEHVLTSGIDFTGVAVSLTADSPDWAKGVSVDAGGNLVLAVKPRGTRIIFR